MGVVYDGDGDGRNRQCSVSRYVDLWNSDWRMTDEVGKVELIAVQ